MKYLFLLRASLWRKPVRAVLTIMAISVAFLMFGVMHGVLASFDTALQSMSDTRLRVMSRASILETLPIAYEARIANVEGVNEVAPVVIFIGYYQNPINGVSAGAVSIESFLAVMPEINVPADQLEALKRTRTGAVAGAELAKKYGWKIGDRIPIQSQLWMNSKTSQDWYFDLVAIANSQPGDNTLYAQELYFHYEYLDEARLGEKGRVHQFIVGIDDPQRADAISEEIDAMFSNSSDESNSVDEKQFLRGQLQRIGDIQSFVYSILGAVLFTLFFLTGTNMMQSMRERIPELGILKSLGFSSGVLSCLVIGESIVLCLLGAAIGLLLAGWIFPNVFAAFGISAISLGADVYLLGVGIAVALAVIASSWPAIQAHRLNIVDAIGGH